MESFLYNNPEILGVIKDDSGEKFDPAIIQQFTTKKGEGRSGRIDLLTLTSDMELNLVLKIIELKKEAKKEDFEQLKMYLEGFNEDNPWKEEILKFIKKNAGIEDDDVAKRIYNKARGLFIAGDFEPELLFKISNWNKGNQNNLIELYKLIQFKTKNSNFILLDKIIKYSELKVKKKSYSWNKMVKYFDELNSGDIFYIKKQFTGDDDIWFKITESKLSVTLTHETIKLMREKRYLEKSQEYGSNADNFPNFPEAAEHLVSNKFPKRTWENQIFKKILSDEVTVDEASKTLLTISNLVQLVLLANSKNRSGWNFGTVIIHKKTGKNYKYFKDNLN